jgi:hypothetical protein
VPSIRRLLRYPRLVVVAGYVAVVLGSLSLGMRLAETPGPDPLELLSSLVTIALGVWVLHHAYTSA